MTSDSSPLGPTLLLRRVRRLLGDWWSLVARVLSLSNCSWRVESSGMLKKWWATLNHLGIARSQRWTSSNCLRLRQQLKPRVRLKNNSSVELIPLYHWLNQMGRRFQRMVPLGHEVATNRKQKLLSSCRKTMKRLFYLTHNLFTASLSDLRFVGKFVRQCLWLWGFLFGSKMDLSSLHGTCSGPEWVGPQFLQS